MAGLYRVGYFNLAAAAYNSERLVLSPPPSPHISIPIKLLQLKFSQVLRNIYSSTRKSIIIILKQYITPSGKLILYDFGVAVNWVDGDGDGYLVFTNL